MASNVGSTAAFTSGNMKPAAGEQIDAVWGQNIADNTGFLRAQRMPFLARYGTEGVLQSGTNLASDAIGEVITQIPIVRLSGHNRIVGTFRGDGIFYNHASPDCTGTHGIYLYGDLGTYGGTISFATSNIGGNVSWGSTYSFELNLDTYLSVGSWGTIVPYFSGTSRDGVNTVANNISFAFGVMHKLYTTWSA